jgi:hypothetical protein
MWEPTRLNFGEGRRFLDEMSDVIQESHRGSGVGMHAHGEHTQHGKPRRVVARDHQPDSRDMGSIRNTGSPVGWWRVTTNRTPARDRPGLSGWRRGP